MGYSLRTDRYTEWRDCQTCVATACELHDHNIDPDETGNVAADDQQIANGKASAGLLASSFGL